MPSGDGNSGPSVQGLSLLCGCLEPRQDLDWQISLWRQLCLTTEVSQIGGTRWLRLELCMPSANGVAGCHTPPGTFGNREQVYFYRRKTNPPGGNASVTFTDIKLQALAFRAAIMLVGIG